MNIKALSHPLLQKAFIVFAFLFLGALYLSPGLNPLFQGDTTIALSDGTDPVTLPFLHQHVVNVFKANPFEIFYGAVPNRVFDAPEGSGMWMPWIERFILLLQAPFIPIEQSATGLVWILLLLNGVCFYAMARSLGWSRSLSFALALCWAFNPFTHARAKVHPAMTGLYFLPLIFLGLQILKSNLKRSAIFLSAVCFLAAAMALHYFIILTVFFSPFFLWFYLPRTSCSEKLKPLLRLSLALLPAIVFMTWNLLQPLPATMIEQKARALPKTGEFKNERGIHPYLEVYAARPIDYLGGDVALGERDLNPLRKQINTFILNNLDNSNSHERANGIRWWLILIALIVLYRLLPITPRSAPLREGNKSLYLLFFIFLAWGFWLSLSPVYFGQAVGPAAWVHSLISQFRVPSRAGVFVHFAVLMIVGFALQDWFSLKTENVNLRSRLKKVVSHPVTLPFLAILSFPPLVNSMPMTAIQPVYTSLTQTDEECGTGMYFPYVSGMHAPLEYYYFLQRLRGTNCSILNANESSARDQVMLRILPLHPQVLSALESSNSEAKEFLSQLASCTGLQWIVFNRYVPREWRKDFCEHMDWQLYDDDEVCKAPTPHTRLQRTPEQCLLGL